MYILFLLKIINLYLLFYIVNIKYPPQLKDIFKLVGVISPFYLKQKIKKHVLKNIFFLRDEFDKKILNYQNNSIANIKYGFLLFLFLERSKMFNFKKVTVVL